uniref:Tetraspanin n=1 Tax=Denticeps clupeoides TaxID=299321 RepID=A0A8C4CL62_9TELE
MGRVQGGMICVKYLLFVFNFIFWLSGSLVLAVGLWLRFDPDTSTLLSENGSPETFFIAVYILIIVGGVMMLVGFFGCCGAVRESQCLLGLFFACLLVIFGAEVAGGVFGFLHKEKVIDEVQSFYREALANNTAIVNVYKKVLNCCDPTEQSLCPNPDDNEVETTFTFLCACYYTVLINMTNSIFAILLFAHCHFLQYEI